MRDAGTHRVNQYVHHAHTHSALVPARTLHGSSGYVSVSVTSRVTPTARKREGRRECHALRPWSAHATLAVPWFSSGSSGIGTRRMRNLGGEVDTTGGGSRRDLRRQRGAEARTVQWAAGAYAPE